MMNIILYKILYHALRAQFMIKIYYVRLRAAKRRVQEVFGEAMVSGGGSIVDVVPLLTRTHALLPNI